MNIINDPRLRAPSGGRGNGPQKAGTASVHVVVPPPPSAAAAAAASQLQPPPGRGGSGVYLPPPQGPHNPPHQQLHQPPQQQFHRGPPPNGRNIHVNMLPAPGDAGRGGVFGRGPGGRGGAPAYRGRGAPHMGHGMNHRMEGSGMPPRQFQGGGGRDHNTLHHHNNHMHHHHHHQQPPHPPRGGHPPPPPPPLPLHSNSNNNHAHLRPPHPPHNNFHHASGCAPPPPPPPPITNANRVPPPPPPPPGGGGFPLPSIIRQHHPPPPPSSTGPPPPYHHQQQQQRPPVVLSQQQRPPPPAMHQRSPQPHSFTPISAASAVLPPQLQLHQAPPSSLAATPPVSAVSVAAAATTPLTVDDAWTEHTAPNSMKYYYNSISKESAWEKPKAMKDKEAGRNWKEYTEPKTGKTYYFDGTTTTWEKPAGFVHVAAEEATALSEAAADSSRPPKKKRKTSPDPKVIFGSRAEAIATFKGLLLAKDIAPTTKWNDVVKLVSKDSRWRDCESFLTNGERRQALAEYQTKRTSELKALERQERQRSRDAFHRMLAERLPSILLKNHQNAQSSSSSSWNNNSNSRGQYSQVRESLVTDDRFHAVADEATREALFQDHLEESRKRQERMQRNKRLEVQESFKAFLAEKRESGKLTVTASTATSWATFLASLDKMELADERFAVSAINSSSSTTKGDDGLTPADRQILYNDYVAEIKLLEEDKLRLMAEEKSKTEKEHRDAFRSSLRSLAQAGQLLPSSRWRVSEELLVKEPTFTPLVEQQGHGTPRAVFEEFIDEWNEVYRRDREFLSHVVTGKKKSMVISPESNYKGFVDDLLTGIDSPSDDTYTSLQLIIQHSDPVSSARLFFDELQMRAKSQPTVRRGSMRRHDYESSEDEGEIKEEGEE